MMGSGCGFSMAGWYVKLTMTTKQATDLTGYNDTTINKWTAYGKIHAVNYYGKNLISKESLAEYLASPKGSTSPGHHKSIKKSLKHLLTENKKEACRLAP